ncbi:hypothetical protein TSMEX_000544 [Taenia solium]|eukprot:TsM_000182000 transcript=TsM_000182000 gene=TsM_000182000
MCEANDSLTSSTRVWPPPEGSGDNFDEMWDDCELLAKYAQVEMQVKAQVEAFRSGKSSLPPPLPSQPQPSSAGNTSIHAPATSGKNDSVTSAPAPNRKKRRHNKNKRKGGGGVSSVRDFDTNHPICSQCSHGGETNQWTPSIASESAAAAAVAAAAANSSYYTAAASSSLPAAPANAGSGSGVAPVYSWLLPYIDLHPELLPPPPPPPLSSATRCSCSHHHFLLPTPSDTAAGAPVTPPASSLPPSLSSLPLTTANGEINTAVLLRAWYEAGYAMGQAHAEQILGLRSSVVETPSGPGDGEDASIGDGEEEEDGDDGEGGEEDPTKTNRDRSFTCSLPLFLSVEQSPVAVLSTASVAGAATSLLG